MTRSSFSLVLLAAVALAGASRVVQAQVPPAPKPNQSPAHAAVAPGSAPVAPDYVIGPDDVLSIVFWRDKDISADVAVRPDGRISLPLLNDVQAGGLTPLQLRDRLTEEARRYVEDPNVTVVVKQINSRRVFITGMVGKPGAYPLAGNMSVVQLISMAGGLSEYANPKKIRILRGEPGKQQSLPFNYRDVASGERLDQNVELKPGDTVVVP